jgi:beta-N-acetylhexosaminidase
MPATFSKKILEDLLRNELGFQGVILSDDLFMCAIKENYSPAIAAVNAIEAGCDMILATDSIEEMIPAIAQLDEQLLDKKIKRIATTLQIAKS